MGTNKQTMLSKLREGQEIYDKYKLSHVYLCGSYSRGEQNKESDLDLYIETKEFLDIYDYFNLKKELEEKFGKKVDIITSDNMKKGVENYIKKDLQLIV